MNYLPKGARSAGRGWQLMTTLDLTLTTVPLEQYFGETRLGRGTGFMWKPGDQYYLVTNWHVLSMCDFFTVPISKRMAAARIFCARCLMCAPAPSTSSAGTSGSATKMTGRCGWCIRRAVWIFAVLPIPFRPNELIIALYPLNELANAETPNRGRHGGVHPRLSVRHQTAGVSSTGSGAASPPNRSSRG